MEMKKFIVLTKDGLTHQRADVIVHTARRRNMDIIPMTRKTKNIGILVNMLTMVANQTTSCMAILVPNAKMITLGNMTCQLVNVDVVDLPIRNTDPFIQIPLTKTNTKSTIT
ncbi:uncharacterized protein LOC143450067 [Clavelina lepadiformis]|uniref:uncharacterized protein LOC143450067 n=1 Tax=Clavelina lepadiformis TaxID=159417 RepID=UPI0040420094